MHIIYSQIIDQSFLQAKNRQGKIPPTQQLDLCSTYQIELSSLFTQPLQFIVNFVFSVRCGWNQLTTQWYHSWKEIKFDCLLVWWFHATWPEASPVTGPLIVLGGGRSEFRHLWCSGGLEGRLLQADTKYCPLVKRLDGNPKALKSSLDWKFWPKTSKIHWIWLI